jgi:hypothetical protein
VQTLQPNIQEKTGKTPTDFKNLPKRKVLPKRKNKGLSKSYPD